MDNKQWFVERYPFPEFETLLKLFVKNAREITAQGSTKGYQQSYRFSSGLNLQTRYGMGNPSQVMYINWHVINIYYHVTEQTLYVAIQDTPEREIQAKRISDYSDIIKDAKIVELPGKGRVYSFFQISDSLEQQDIENLYSVFIDICGNVSALVSEVELKKWSFGDSKPGYTVKRLTHEERVEARNGLTSALRIQILVRDESTCQMCGKTPKDNSIRLAVDHIYPLSRGGTNDPSNLRTLCQECNSRKGARIA